MKTPPELRPVSGRLGILLPGLGAVATTFIAGVEMIRRGLAEPIGSLTQMGTIRLGKRTDATSPRIGDFVPLAPLDSIEFGAWDIFPDNAYTAASKAGVLSKEHLSLVKDFLEGILPMKAVFDPGYVKRLDGTHVTTGTSKMDLAEQLMEDIARFKRERNVDRCVAVWCGSTETWRAPTAVHATLEAFEQGLRDSSDDIAPSAIYAYACLRSGVPYANGAPNLSVDFPALHELARRESAPIAGKDFKTGQTLMKTILAPGFKARLLGLDGWYSTNILGNRDGEVLDDPDSFRSKEVSKLGVLESILPKHSHPALYGNVTHKVRIDYYPPRGDQKEGWDNIDLFGWLGYPMQLKLNFLCRDSILAAPIVLDLALLLDLAHRAGMSGMQDWLGFYFKAPMSLPGTTPEHDLFVQQVRLHDAIRRIAREEL